MIPAGHIDDELLSAHLDSALNPAESAAVSSHLFSCGECSARLARLRATVDAVAGMPLLTPPRNIDLAFTSSGEENLAPIIPLRRRWPAWAMPAAAAAVVAILAVPVGAAFLSHSRGPSSATSTALNDKAGDRTHSESRFQSAQGPGAPAPAPPDHAAGSGSAPGGAAFAAPNSQLARVPDSTLGLSLATDPGSANAGQDVTLTGTVRASRDVRLRSVSIELAGGYVLSSVQDGRTLSSGQALELRTNWAAGRNSGGSQPAAGNYTLILRVTYLDATGQSQEAHTSVDYRVS